MADLDPLIVRPTAGDDHAAGTHKHRRLVAELNVVTTVEAAETLRVSKMTVCRLIHAGQLPAMRIGRSFRIHRQDLSDYINQNRTAAVEK